MSSISFKCLAIENSFKDEDEHANSKAESHNDQFVKKRYFLTGLLAIGFLNFGFTLSTLGVSIPTFVDNLRITVEDISPVVVTRGLGYIAGALCVGKLEQWINRLYLVCGSLVISAIGTALIPVVLNIYSVMVFIAISSFGLSGFETMGNVIVLRLWKKKGQAVLHFLYFSYSIGATIIPLVMEPFLNEAHPENKKTSNKTSYNYPDIKYIKNTSIPLLSVPYFLIAAFILLLVFVIFLKIPPSCLSEIDVKESKIIQRKKWHRYIMLFGLFFFFVFYNGFEMTFGAYLYVFSTSSASGMKLTKEKGVYMYSIYLFSYVIGQFLAIFAARIFSSLTILLSDLFGVVISGALMLLIPFYGTKYPNLFWVGVVAASLSASSIHGSTFHWTEDYLSVDGNAASIMMFGGSVGEMLLPLPVGYKIEDNPMFFLYAYYTYILAACATFFLVWQFARCTGKRMEIDKTNANESEKSPQLLMNADCPSTSMLLEKKANNKRQSNTPM